MFQEQMYSFYVLVDVSALLVTYEKNLNVLQPHLYWFCGYNGCEECTIQ